MLLPGCLVSGLHGSHHAHVHSRRRAHSLYLDPLLNARLDVHCCAVIPPRCEPKPVDDDELPHVLKA